MRILKKINKGVVLSAIIILGIIVYLLVHSAYNKAQIPVLEELSDEFITEHQKLLITPENLKPDDKYFSVQNTEYEKAIKELEDKAKAIFDPLYHNNYINITANDVMNNAINMHNLFITIVDYQKQIDNRSYNFEDNFATIEMRTTITLEYIDENGIKQKSYHQQQYDSITYEKIDGEWKVVYATLSGTEMVKGGDDYYSGRQTQKEVYY